MRRVKGLVRAGTAVTIAVLGTGLLATGPAWAEEQTVVDVLSLVDGEYVVETVTVPARTAQAEIDDLEAEPAVVAAGPQVFYEPTVTDPLWQADDPGAVSSVEDVWASTRGAGQVVAVLDTALTPSHPDLEGAILPGTDTVGATADGWHGVGVAGVIAARADNAIGGAGMAPEAKILPVRVCDSTCPSDAVARGILWAADHGADVINLSLAGAGYSDVTAVAIQYALDKNISVVASAGNDGLNGNPVMYPAANAGVIAVSATDPGGTPASWAVHGWQADIATVGESVLLPYPGGTYVSADGTSFSGPAVAGAVALLRAAHPGITPAEVQAALQAGADGSSWDRQWGAGRLDLPAAFAAAEHADAPPTVTASSSALLVSWPAVAGATGYTVRVDGVVKATLSGTSVQIGALPAVGTQVAVDVQPSNGNRSRPALVTVAPVAAGVPVLHGVSLRGTSSSAVLDVQASVSGAPRSSYALIRDGVNVGTYGFTLGTSTSTVSLAIGAMPTTQTQWQLRAIDTYGRMSTNSNAVTTGSALPAPPAAVTGLSATVDGAEARLTWDDLGSAYSYEVRVGTDVVASPATAGAVLAAPPPGVTRTYEVRAVDAWGQTGPAVTTDLLITPVAPGAPTSVRATPGDAQATVSWVAPESIGSEIGSYTVTASPGGATATTSGLSAVVTGLTNGTAYTFTVTATNDAGSGSASAPSDAVTPRPVPDAPTAVTADPWGGSAQVSWTAPPATGIPVTRYTVTTSPGGRTATTAGGTVVTVTGLTNGTAYTFTVTATNASGTGPASAPSAPVTPRGIPGPPTNVAATAGDRSAVVTWSAPADDGASPITGYTVQAYPGQATATTTGALTATVTGLTNGIAYTFRVTATNAVGTSWVGTASPAARPFSSTDDRLTAGEQLDPGEQVRSADARYRLVMQTDGNVVLYGPTGAVWASRTRVAGTVLRMQPDGNLVAYAPGGMPVWFSLTGGNPGASAVVQRDGNLVVYRTGGTGVWASKNRDRLTAGMRLASGQQIQSGDRSHRLVMQRDGNLVLYGPSGAEWNSRTRSAGAYLAVQADGNVVVYSASRRALWNSRTGGNAGAYLVVANAGRALLYRATGTAAWAVG